MAVAVSPRAVVGARRRHWIRWVAAVTVVVVLVAGSVGWLLDRQWIRPLSLSLDDNVAGDVHAINTSHGQTGQWYAPYGPHRFELALTFWSSRAVRLDSVGLAGGDVVQRPATYNVGLESYDQAVAPAAQRRPLHATLVPAKQDFTVVISMRYLCDPPQRGTTAEFVQAWVTWQLWGEHHTQWMSLPQPLITQAGGACPRLQPVPGPAGS